jgi:Sec-independent protein translocase protein TatA
MVQTELARHPSFRRELKTQYFHTKADSLSIRRYIPTNASLDKAALVKDTKMSLVGQDEAADLPTDFKLRIPPGALPVVLTVFMLAEGHSRASEWARKINEGTKAAREATAAREAEAKRVRAEAQEAFRQQQREAQEVLRIQKAQVRAAKEAVRQQRAERAAKRGK